MFSERCLCEAMVVGGVRRRGAGEKWLQLMCAGGRNSQTWSVCGGEAGFCRKQPALYAFCAQGRLFEFCRLHKR